MYAGYEPPAGAYYLVGRYQRDAGNLIPMKISMPYKEGWTFTGTSEDNAVLNYEVRLLDFYNEKPISERDVLSSYLF